MCIEIYSPTHKISIPFIRERVSFLSARSYVANYTFLVRNDGPIRASSSARKRNSSLDKLYLIYPHYLFDRITNPSNKTIMAKLPCVRDLTGAISDNEEDSEFEFFGGNVRIPIGNPNNPMKEHAGLWGKLYTDNLQVVVSPIFRKETARALDLMQMHDYSLWTYQLTKPIEIHAAGKVNEHWYRIGIVVIDTGVEIEETVLGQACVYHKIASAMHVKYTIYQRFENALIDKAKLTVEQEYVLKELMKDYAVSPNRHVDNGYYELLIGTGDPRDQFMINWHSEGDIRMMAMVPRLEEQPYDLALDEYPELSLKDYQSKHEKKNRNSQFEPYYDWKSGSTLLPKHSLSGKGFTLSFALAYSK